MAHRGQQVALFRLLNKSHGDSHTEIHGGPCQGHGGLSAGSRV